MRRRMLFAIAAAGLLGGCATGTDAVNQSAGGEKGFVPGQSSRQQWPIGKRVGAPAISGETLTGGSLDLSSMRGKVVVLNFWGQWCAPCRAEAGDLERVYQATAAKGVQFVGVNIRDTKDKAAAFQRTNGVTYPSLYDPYGRVAVRFRQTPPTTIPATIVIDRAGRVAALFRDAVLESELRPVVLAVAGEKP
ncbi:TlpA family protein disulfide reductase [Fodinicola acaciae]|uniref:TlpA family protein disulfide reductase n=1 Tax=Fodinicola acaciae TaxID=2681555 RepID=UPI0013D3FCE0|nr:TlpA disulfide reductase family protein [Fodinicola acaciae]